MTEQSTEIYSNRGADNKMGMPLEHYSSLLGQSDPEELAARGNLSYSAEKGCFQFVLLGRKIEVEWPSAVTTYADDGQEVPANVKILLLRLVLEGRLVPSSGKFLAYREIPWGETYLEPFTGRCIKRFCYMFPTAQAYAQAAAKLGGSPVQSKADAAFEFDFLDGLRLQMIFWERDEEFEPQAQILFSDNFPAAFTAEDLAHVGDIILGQLRALRG